MNFDDVPDRALAHCVLDAARDGDYIPDELMAWALAITGDLQPNMASRRFAVFVQTGPGTLQ